MSDVAGCSSRPLIAMSHFSGTCPSPVPINGPLEVNSRNMSRAFGADDRKQGLTPERVDQAHASFTRKAKKQMSCVLIPPPRLDWQPIALFRASPLPVRATCQSTKLLLLPSSNRPQEPALLMPILKMLICQSVGRIDSRRSSTCLRSSWNCRPSTSASSSLDIPDWR